MQKIQRKKRRFITLIEIMVVMFLIALIMGVLAYNFTGTLDEGKAFKTHAAIEKLDSYLNIAVANGNVKLDEIESRWQDVVKSSPLVKNPNTLLRDGWGEPFDVTVQNGRIVIRSQKYEQYIKEHPSSITGGGH